MTVLLNFSDDEKYYEYEATDEPLCATEEVMYELDFLDTLISNNLEFFSSHFR